MLRVFSLPGVRARRLLTAGGTLIAFCGAIGLCRPPAVWAADLTRRLTPLIAQETASEGGYAIVEWAIVVLFTAAALFAICRSSRRT